MATCMTPQELATRIDEYGVRLAEERVQCGEFYERLTPLFEAGWQGLEIAGVAWKQLAGHELNVCRAEDGRFRLLVPIGVSADNAFYFDAAEDILEYVAEVERNLPQPAVDVV